MVQVQKTVPETDPGQDRYFVGLPAGKGTTLGINTLLDVMTTAG